MRRLTFTRERWIQRIFTKSLFALCSLTFFNVNNSIIIKEFLQKLPSPHHLHYLSLNFTWSYDADIQDMIRTIFKLPNLRRLEWWSYWVEESFGIVDDPSLSLEHFSIDCNESYHFLQILPFMPNLITLKLSYKFDSFDLISVQANSLSKLKSLQMNDVYTYDQVHYMFQLCPHVKIFKLQHNASNCSQPMTKATDWEHLLSPMKFLREIDININEIRDINIVNSLEYETEFWVQRNLKVIVYDDPETCSTTFRIKNNPNIPDNKQ
ncbi:unnamed protein product [Rotaria sp. Silwood2]|nr:unnamed protein product [Rotaria sp. Silwood2]